MRRHSLTSAARTAEPVLACPAGISAREQRQNGRGVSSQRLPRARRQPRYHEGHRVAPVTRISIREELDVTIDAFHPLGLGSSAQNERGGIFTPTRLEDA